MRFSTICKILGIFLMLFSFTMLPPAIVAWHYHEVTIKDFSEAFELTFLVGLLLWFMFRNVHYEFKTRDGFLIVVLFWSVLSFFGSFPFIFSPQPHISITDAIFESTSGLTTTGASVLSNLRHLPLSILYYRQQLQFLGGMGIIVLAVAILPILGVGGMQLYRAEMPGHNNDNKLTPRITQTAKALWGIYIVLTILCLLCYWAAGMNLFQAIGESFSTVATGGFSLHANSIAFYHSNTIKFIGIVFMFLSGANYSLHFYALSQQSLSGYWKDIEFRMYFLTILCLGILVIFALLFSGLYHHFKQAAIDSFFNVTSLVTTTGLLATSFQHWPTFVKSLLMMVAIVGGCAGSTCGGIKIIRVLLLEKQALREMKMLMHPNLVLPIKFGDTIFPERVIQAMWGFIAVFMSLFAVLFIILLATGLDIPTAFGALVASLANAGVGIGQVHHGFADINIFAKWILIFAMLAGRLEIFTLLLLFIPSFWEQL